MVEREIDLQTPLTISLSISLLWCSLIFGTINYAYHWPGLISLMPETLDFLARSSLLFCTNLFTFSIMIWVICKITFGHNWARIMLFLGFIVMLPLMVPTIIEMAHYSETFVYISVITFFLELVALCLLFSSPSNQWFKKNKKLKQILQEK